MSEIDDLKQKAANEFLKLNTELINQPIKDDVSRVNLIVTSGFLQVFGRLDLIEEKIDQLLKQEQ